MFAIVLCGDICCIIVGTCGNGAGWLIRRCCGCAFCGVGVVGDSVVDCICIVGGGFGCTFGGGLGCTFGGGLGCSGVSCAFGCCCTSCMFGCGAGRAFGLHSKESSSAS